MIYDAASDLAAALRGRSISSRELLEAHLDRVEDVDGETNAVVVRDYERARERAAAADNAAARDKWWGPLHGLPMTVKEAFDIVGFPTTSGSTTMSGYTPRRNAVTVQRLLDAGAVIYGKTNLPIWAGDIQTYNDIYGTTNNPWDLGRTPGGSSGGSAAALAAGFTPLELGSDIGGSIRNPAHYCGVYGHKPTYGIVPLRGHIPGPPGMARRADLAVAGPLARNAGDLALAMGVLAGPDDDEAVAWRYEVPPPRHRNLADFRVAAWLDDEQCPVDPDVGAVLERVIASLEEAGVNVDRAARPDVSAARSGYVFQRLLMGEVATGFTAEDIELYRRLEAGFDETDTSATAGRVRGVVQTHREWISADESRHRMRRAWACFFEKYDVMLTPAMPTVAFPHDQTPMTGRTVTLGGQAFPYFDQTFWSGLAGVALLPATVAPAGLADSGLPAAMPEISPPPDSGTTTSAVSGRSSTSSRPIVP